MLQLKVEGKWATLTDQSISWEAKSSLFTFDYFESEYSYSIFLPSEGNEVLFQHPHEISTVRSPYEREYEAEIYFGGVLFRRGWLRLKRTARPGYEGTLKAQAGFLAPHKDKKLKELFRDEIHPFLSGELSELNAYTDHEYLIFPTVFMGDRLYNNYRNGYQSVFYDARSIVPMLRKWWVLERAFELCGWKVCNDWTANHPDIKKEFFLSNVSASDVRRTDVEIEIVTYPEEGTGRPATDSIDAVKTEYPLRAQFPLAYAVPDITLRELINAFRKQYGLVFDWDSNQQTVQIHFLRDIFQSTEEVDWTHLADPDYDTEPSGLKKGLTLAWTLDNGDPHIEGQVEELNDDEDLEVAAYGDLLTLSEAYRQKPHLVRDRNQLWKEVNVFVSDDSSYGRMKRIYDDFRLFRDGEEEKEIRTAFSPVPVTNSFTIKFTADLRSYTGLVNTGNLQVVIYDQPLLYAPPTRDYPMWVTFHNSETFENETPYTVIYNDVAGAVLELSSTLGTELESNIELTLKVIVPFFVPYSKRTVFHLFEEEEPEAMPPRIAFYHGLYPAVDDSFIYPYACSDDTDNQGNIIAKYSLRWKGQNGHVETFWQDYLLFWRNTRIVNYPIKFRMPELLDWKPSQIVRINDNRFLVRRIPLSLGENMPAANVEFWKLQGVECCQEEFEITILPCECEFEITILNCDAEIDPETGEENPVIDYCNIEYSRGNSTEASIEEFDFDLVPGQGWFAVDFDAYGDPDRLDLVHNGSVVASTTLNGAPAAIGANMGNVETRITEFEAATGENIDLSAGYLQRVWWQFSAADFAGSQIVTVRVMNGAQANSWRFTPICVSSEPADWRNNTLVYFTVQPVSRSSGSVLLEWTDKQGIDRSETLASTNGEAQTRGVVIRKNTEITVTVQSGTFDRHAVYPQVTSPSFSNTADPMSLIVSSPKRIITKFL